MSSDLRPATARAIYVRCCQCLRDAAMVRGQFGMRPPDGWAEVYAKEIGLEPASVLIRICAECIQPEPRSAPIDPKHFLRGTSYDGAPTGRSAP